MSATILGMTQGPLQTNCYLLGCDQTGMAAVIDPAWDAAGIFQQVSANQLTISHILLTHTHFDHVGGLAEMKALTNAPIYCHPEAVPMLEWAHSQAELWGFHMPPTPPADNMLQPNEFITIGELSVKVLFTPGHAPGHVSFYLPAEHVLFDGDVLFKQSIGRTDLPGGDFQQLMDSIWQQLMVLPDETQLLPGHMGPTTVGQERYWNPFLQE